VTNFLRISVCCFRLLLLLTCSLASLAQAEHAGTSDLRDGSVLTVESGGKFDHPTEARKLYRRYKKNYDKAIIAIACVRSPKCIEPEDEVLRYSQDALKVLQKLDQLASEGDVAASFYRGLIAFERGGYYENQATQITHPDFILTATVFRKYALEQFTLSEKMMLAPGKEGNSDACSYLGKLYSGGGLGYVNQEKATASYYCAATGFLTEGRKIKAAEMYNAMKLSAVPNDSRVVELYAKLHNEEPVVSWRKLPDTIKNKSEKSITH